MDKTIHHKIVFDADPHEVYEALMDSEKHAQFTNAKAEISRENGGSFSVFDGKVTGYNIKIVPDEKIIQFWRTHTDDWPEGHLSRVEFWLKKKGSGTLLRFTHSDVPENSYEHLDLGWHKNYWAPLKAMLEK